LSGSEWGSRTLWFALLEKSGDVNIVTFVKCGEIHDEVSNFLASQGQGLNLLFNGLWYIFPYGEEPVPTPPLKRETDPVFEMLW
jgi:hypothetical protein